MKKLLIITAMLSCFAFTGIAGAATPTGHHHGGHHHAGHPHHKKA